MNVTSVQKSGARGDALRLLPLALAGFGLVLFSTPWGLGLGGDSFYYVSGARNLVEGMGFSRPAGSGGVLPITHFPPLYAVLLAGPVALGFDAAQAARWLSAALFAGSLFLAGLILLRSTGLPLLALAGQTALLAAPVMLSVHSWVLSEPLFHFLLILTILLAGRLRDPGPRNLLAVAMTASLSFLTRYVGAFLIAACGVALILAPGRRLVERFRETVLFLGIALLAPVLWLVRNFWVGGTLTNRAPSWHPVTSDLIRGALETTSLWVLPASVPSSVRTGLTLMFGLGILGAGAVLIWGRGQRTDPNSQLAVAANYALLPLAFVSVYVLSLMTSLSVLDAATPVDDRILSPLYPAGVLLALILAGAVLKGRSAAGAVRIVAGIVIGLFLLFTIREGYLKVQSLRADGQGYAGRGWAGSALIEAVRELPPQAPIYTNELDAIYLLTGRAAFQVPIRWDPMLDAPRRDYPEQLALMRERLEEQGGALVLFASFARQAGFLGSEEDLTRGLSVVLRADEGVMYSRGP